MSPTAEAAHCEAVRRGPVRVARRGCETLEGQALTHDFDMFTTQPGEEVLSLCQSWTLNNAEEIWVNAVELSQDVASHHSNWTYVPDNLF